MVACLPYMLPGRYDLFDSRWTVFGMAVGTVVDIFWAGRFRRNGRSWLYVFRSHSRTVDHHLSDVKLYNGKEKKIKVIFHIKDHIFGIVVDTSRVREWMGSKWRRSAQYYMRTWKKTIKPPFTYTSILRPFGRSPFCIPKLSTF